MNQPLPRSNYLQALKTLPIMQRLNPWPEPVCPIHRFTTHQLQLQSNCLEALRTFFSTQSLIMEAIFKPPSKSPLPSLQVDHESATATIQLPASPHVTPNNPNPKPLRLDLSAMTAIGRHNRENAAAAALLCMALELPSLSPSLIQQALPSLTPPPHRMQLGEKLEIDRE